MTGSGPSAPCQGDAPPERSERMNRGRSEAKSQPGPAASSQRSKSLGCPRMCAIACMTVDPPTARPRGQSWTRSAVPGGHGPVGPVDLGSLQERPLEGARSSSSTRFFVTWKSQVVNFERSENFGSPW